MTFIQFDKNNKNYEIIEYDNLVEGSKDTAFVKLVFGEYVGGVFTPDNTIATNNDLQVGVVYTRSDGKHTWFIPATPMLDGTFINILQGWTLRKKGLLSLDYQIKNITNGAITTYNRVNLIVNEGTSLDDNFVFTEADYDALLEIVNNRLATIITSSEEPDSPDVNTYWNEVLED